MTFLDRLLGKDPLLDLSEVVTNLEFFAGAEVQISDFYRLCAGAMKNEQELWNSLADDELRHAENVRKMIELITGWPQLYKPGVSFATAAVRMFSLEMQNLVDRMNRGQIPPDQLFGIALEIENSAVEISYSKLVKTRDQTYKSLAGMTDSGSAQHQSTLASRINSARG